MGKLGIKIRYWAEIYWWWFAFLWSPARLVELYEYLSIVPADVGTTTPPAEEVVPQQLLTPTTYFEYPTPYYDSVDRVNLYFVDSDYNLNNSRTSTRLLRQPSYQRNQKMYYFDSQHGDNFIYKVTQ